MADQLSSGMIGVIAISNPPEDNTDISRYAQLALVLQELEEDEVQNLEEKELMFMRDGKLVTMMQQQEEESFLKSTEKEQQETKSMLTGKALLIVHSVPYLCHHLQSSIPQNLGIASKVTILSMGSIFFFVDRLLHLQALFRVARKMPLWT